MRDVELPRRGVKLPPSCARCSARPTREAWLFEYKPWDGVHVPVCEACWLPVQGGLVLRRLLVLGAATAGAIVAQELFPDWLVRVAPATESARALFEFLWVPGGVLGALPLGLLFHFVWRPRIDVTLRPRTVTFECGNEPWAAELRRLNPEPEDGEP